MSNSASLDTSMAISMGSFQSEAMLVRAPVWTMRCAIGSSEPGG